MDLSKIIEYQTLDSKLFKIERELKNNENKRIANQMHQNMKDAQTKTLKLEERAGALLAEIEKVKKQFQIQQEKMNEFVARDLSKMSKEEVDKLSVLKDKLSQNLVILDKNLSSLAETVNAVLSEFNKTIKLANNCKEQYMKCKQAYENDVKAVEKDKNDIINELKKLEKGIDGKIMGEYKKRRNENIFPVLDKLNGNSCGGCHIELPYANISSLDANGILSCEHCHRLIYKG